MSGNIEANQYYSPTFIKAKTPEELEKKMLQKNIKDGRLYHYKDISFVKGFWYAWYDFDHSKLVKIVGRKKESN
jgi:hypothetical protein